MDKADLEKFTQYLTKKVFQQGEILIEQDDVPDSTYIIISGSVKVYRLLESGEQISLAILGSDEIIGELSLINDEPRSAYVEAINETQVLELKKQDFLNILLENPQTAINLLKTLSKRVRETNQKLEDIVSQNLYVRTWKTLQTLSNHFPSRNITLSQEELAEIIGATRARVTEVLNQLQNDGKITLSHRHIQII